MANTQINISTNGTTTLATAGKYCDRNIDVNVSVAGGGSGGTWDDATIKAIIERTVTSVVIPEGVKDLGDYTFHGCSQLTSVTFPSSITRIGTRTFHNCSKLVISSIPSSVTYISTYAFGFCSGLTSITFEGTPTSIHTNAFQNCDNLTTINVPWAEGAISNAPWGATNATINYNYTV